jgi:mannosyltransferase
MGTVRPFCRHGPDSIKLGRVSAAPLARGELRAAFTGDRASLTGRLATPVLAAVTGLTMLAAVMRFYDLGHQGFWFDEANTAMLVRLSPGKMLGLIPQSESTPPLYYCVAWLWTHVFGDAEAGLRSLSAAAGVLTVPVAFAAAAKLISRRAGVIAAALTACSPLLIWYSQEARSYELLVLLTAIALMGFAYARDRPTPWALALWAVASALALATHYYAVLAVVPQAGWLLWRHRSRPAVRVAVAIVALCGLALIPLAISQNGAGNDSWIAAAPFGARLGQVIPQFLIGTNAPDRTLLKYAAMALALVAVGLVAIRGRSAERRAALVAGGLVGAGVALCLMLIAAGFDDLITRNIIALWLPAAILVAGGLALERARGAGAAVTVLLCALGIAVTAGIDANRSLQRPDWRQVAAALGPQPAHGAERVILVQHYRTLLPLSLYLPHLGFLPAGGARVSELDIVSDSAPSQPLCWWGAACNLDPSRLQPRYDMPGFHALWRRQVLQFTILRLISSRPLPLTPTVVSAALTSTSLRRDVLLLQRG